MARYHHLRLSFDKYVAVESTDVQTLNAIYSEAKQFIPGAKAILGKGRTLSGQPYCYLLKKVKKRDYDAFHSVIEWLCRDGWEPFAIHGNVGGSYGDISTSEIYHFRKEVQQPEG